MLEFELEEARLRAEGAGGGMSDLELLDRTSEMLSTLETKTESGDPVESPTPPMDVSIFRNAPSMEARFCKDAHSRAGQWRTPGQGTPPPPSIVPPTVGG